MSVNILSFRVSGPVRTFHVSHQGNDVRVREESLNLGMRGTERDRRLGPEVSGPADKVTIPGPTSCPPPYENPTVSEWKAPLRRLGVGPIPLVSFSRENA